MKVALKLRAVHRVPTTVLIRLRVLLDNDFGTYSHTA